MICVRSIGPLTFDPKIKMNKLLAMQTTTTSSIRFSSLRRRRTRNCRWQSNDMPRRQNESGLLQRLKNEPLTGLCLRFPRAVRSLWEATNYKCDCTGAVFRHEFETRSLPRSLGRRGNLYLLCLPRRSRGEGGSLIPSSPFTNPHQNNHLNQGGNN